MGFEKKGICCYAVVQFNEGLRAQRGGRGAAGGGREVRVAAQVARQPRQVAVAHEAVVAQLEAAQSEQRLEHIFAQRRHVVVVQSPAPHTKLLLYYTISFSFLCFTKKKNHAKSATHETQYFL